MRHFFSPDISIPHAGLYHYKARVYDPKIGRFLQTDPIGTAGGLNLYAYVGNDPANLVDPSGLDHCFSDELDVSFQSGSGQWRYTGGDTNEVTTSWDHRCMPNPWEPDRDWDERSTITLQFGDFVRPPPPSPDDLCRALKTANAWAEHSEQSALLSNVLFAGGIGALVAGPEATAAVWAVGGFAGLEASFAQFMAGVHYSYAGIDTGDVENALAEVTGGVIFRLARLPGRPGRDATRRENSAFERAKRDVAFVGNASGLAATLLEMGAHGFPNSGC